MTMARFSTILLAALILASCQASTGSATSPTAQSFTQEAALAPPAAEPESVSTPVAPAPNRASPISVIVTIPHIRCHRATSNDDRDELYILTGGGRLPSGDDYYEAFSEKDLWPQFTNQDQRPQPAPELWRGTIADGQKVAFLCVAGEQDNKDLKKIAEALEAVGRFLLGSSDDQSFERMAIEAAALVSSRLPEGDGRIGAFTTILENRGGQLFMQVESAAEGTAVPTEAGEWVMRYKYLRDKFPALASNSMYVDCHGTESSHYWFLVHAAVQ